MGARAQNRGVGEFRPVVAHRDQRLGPAGHERIHLARPALESDVLAATAKHSRVKSCTTVSMRKRRPSLKTSATKSKLQRWLGPRSSAMGARVPRTRLHRHLSHSRDGTQYCLGSAPVIAPRRRRAGASRGWTQSTSGPPEPADVASRTCVAGRLGRAAPRARQRPRPARSWSARGERSKPRALHARH